MYSWTIPVGDQRVEIRSTTVADGDFAVGLITTDRDALIERRRAIVDQPWTWLRQVHEADLVVAESPGADAGTQADGVLTHTAGVPIAVTTADCSPVVLVSSTGVAVVHAGWRGAQAGIIERAAERLLGDGATPVASVLGPCIGVEHYEFGASDLESMVATYGPGVAGLTEGGTPGLDMQAVVAAACRRAGWPPPDATACTSDERFFSHRRRGDRGRQTTVAWIEDDESPTPTAGPTNDMSAS